MTRPTIRAVAMSEPNDAGWYNSDVSVQFTCADALSGLAADACPAHQLLDSEGETVISTAQTITDAAGNISDSSNVVTVKLDKTPPTLNPVVSPDPLFVGDSAAISTGAADLLSGVAHASCDALDTRTAGVKSVTCVAGDDAGNRASVTVEVLVDEADEDTPTETEQSNRVFLPGVMR